MNAQTVVFALTLAQGVPASAVEQMTDVEKASTESISERGRVIYFYDQAAWHTTDTLKEDIKNLNASGIRGWVVTPVVNGLKVTYFAIDGQTPRAVYTARYDGGKVHDRKILTAADDRALSSAEMRIFEAQAKASAVMARETLSKKVFQCAAIPFNTVAIPLDGTDSGMAIYYLTPQTSNHVIPIGGHYRVDIPIAGEPKWRKFSNTCLNMTLDPKMPPSGMVFASHILDPYPTEVHAFLSRTARLNLAILTVQTTAIWGITQGKISLEQRQLPK